MHVATWVQTSAITKGEEESTRNPASEPEAVACSSTGVANGGALSSSGPRSVRIDRVSTAEARNVTPFTTKAAAGEPRINSSPPSAGPSA